MDPQVGDQLSRTIHNLWQACALRVMISMYRVRAGTLVGFTAYVCDPRLMINDSPPYGV